MRPRVAFLLSLVFLGSVLAGCTASSPPGASVAPASSNASTTPGAPAGEAANATPVVATAPANATGKGAIRHVFVIVLENEDANASFGPHPGSTYLARNLTRMGVFLPNYYGVGHASLDNYVAMVSGQAPNVETQADCSVYADFAGAPVLDRGQAVGEGCVYPAFVPTIGDQLDAANLTWRAYAEDMADHPGSAPTSCRHGPLNQPERWGGSAGDLYATRHEPFVYFHGIIDDRARCDAHVVDLSLLPHDLESANTTPSYVFITPNVCSDGHDSPCPNASRPGGYAGIDAFLRSWVPRILASPAYQQGGLLVVTFDEAGSDSSACCAEQPGPGSPVPGENGPGGGRVGAVLLAPCLPANTTDQAPANHYSLLRTVEDLFGLGHLGYAAQAGLKDIALPGCGGPARGSG